MPHIQPQMTTVDDVVRVHAAKAEKLYNDRTAGDSTFLGMLVHFLMDLSPVIGANLLRGGTVTVEPPANSVVMVHGRTGTAYQKFSSDDGLWHSTTGRTLTWAELVATSGPRGPILLTDGTDSDRN